MPPREAAFRRAIIGVFGAHAAISATNHGPWVAWPHGGMPGWKSSSLRAENACNEDAAAAILTPFARAFWVRARRAARARPCLSAFEVVAE